MNSNEDRDFDGCFTLPHVTYYSTSLKIFSLVFDQTNKANELAKKRKIRAFEIL